MVFEILATAAPLLFAYAVLRHKVVDIGFAVNRALVYGVVSTILLVTFGIVEWASEHFLPIKNLETNALIDGGIALAIFLAFHRLRDLSGHVIEGLFFRQWRENEVLLRRFVKEAAFIGTKAALGKAIVAEWTRFSGGAPSALYLAGAGRDFVAFQVALCQGELAGAQIDGDDPLIVALRAHGEAVELSDTKSLLPASLALPMRHRGELTGLMLMAGKPSDDPYRPDEQELLGWAAHQVGLDLQALETEQLQDDVSQLKQDCARLTAQLDLVRELGLKTAGKPG
jgi:GAF domain-containing protein